MANDNTGGYTLDYVPCTNRAYYKRARKMLHDSRGYYCVRCPAVTKLEAHHIDGDITNCNSNNLEWLCRECHEKHHGLR